MIFQIALDTKIIIFQIIQKIIRRVGAKDGLQWILSSLQNPKIKNLKEQ